MTATQDAPVGYEPQPGPWEMLSAMLPTADWTMEAAAGQIAPAVDSLRVDEPTGGLRDNGETPTNARDVYDRIARALYRREQRHVLVSGLKGVGKTAVIRELARRAAAGDVAFLKGCRFLWIDASDVGPEDSRACLETIATIANQAQSLQATVPKDENLERAVSRILETAFEVEADGEPSRVILCIDGIDALLKRPQGGTNKPLLRAIAARSGLQIIGILNRWAFNDLIAGDAQMLELFTHVEIDEPNEDTACEILRQKAAGFRVDYGLEIDDTVVQRTITLASNYLLNECHPVKGIKILRQVCDEADYEATQRGRERRPVTTDDVVRVVAEITGIPEATLAGDSGEADFEQALTEAVVGQERAVKASATELRLIKAGLSEPGKPAGVLLFAGMTGVGKTELAKRIAELYSTSKRLQTYSMGNFTEPHSVSGINGVPPGYVGYEEGGRLINELNADPYSVFLLDEAEKCHPNVWKPFLNLFDEGWIVDQRGVKAYADRAIFILTTNAGDKTIAQMSRQGKSEEEIVERVKATLSRVRQERSSQPVFAPQFLSRLKRIVVFGPLDEDAMIGIAQKIVKQVAELWRQKREKEFIVSDALIERIGRRAFALNEKANGEEGGRIVRKLISDLIEHRVQLEASDRREAYRGCRRIVVGLQPANAAGDAAGNADDGGDPPVAVDFSE